ncbi:unnamed protein product [Spirodela intermedia]|uniref:Uncharacterized protein n=1 Tax=Spirodela intermedia TaxID=51605 RepID=A0A7I8KZS1_SPIIN|nr:unnamed protein product [Spirodela intermedia]
MFRSLHLNFSLPLSVPLPRATRWRRLSPVEHLGGAVARLSASPSSAAAEAVPRPWSGLTNWRESPINENLIWGPDGPQKSSTAPPLWGVGGEDPDVDVVSSLAGFAALVLRTSDPLEKVRISHLAFGRWLGGDLPVGEFRAPDRPARPMKPVLVSMRDVPAPKNSGLPLNAYMIHNLAHVELNAVDLAWDTVVRFSPQRDVLGDQFFSDFAHVADEECRHFSWCSQRLAELGFRYGDMPAHDLLWSECERSSHNVGSRLAVIPLVQEARGLDAGPRLVQKLMGFGDHRSARLVEKIAEEEVAHVAVGLYWFLAVCEEMGRPPSAAFKDLLNELGVEPKGPFNYLARDEAGIPREWYELSSASGRRADLSQVHDRLSRIVAMEKENSRLESSSRERSCDTADGSS